MARHLVGGDLVPIAVKIIVVTLIIKAPELAIVELEKEQAAVV
jgi:hypothetical protein